ncbi:MAG: hypothetical protein WCT05_16805 [Lentisphaeria bacterium]
MTIDYYRCHFLQIQLEGFQLYFIKISRFDGCFPSSDNLSPLGIGILSDEFRPNVIGSSKEKTE